MSLPPDWTTLRIFLTALELGSIAKAAERCGIANSAAARRIQMLEVDCGMALVERRARGIVATTAGDILAGHARGLMQQARQLVDDLRTHAEGGSGTVRILAAASAIGGHDLADRLAGFAGEHPRIVVELKELVSLTIIRELTEGSADIGIITTSGDVPAGLDAAVWRHDRLVVVTARRHPLAGRASLTYDDVLGVPMVDAVEFGAISLLLAEKAGERGRRPNRHYRTNSIDAARRLIASGLAVGILPDRMAEPFGDALELACIPLDEPWALRHLRIVSRQTALLSMPARLLLAYLLDPVVR